MNSMMYNDVQQMAKNIRSLIVTEGIPYKMKRMPILEGIWMVSLAHMKTDTD